MATTTFMRANSKRHIVRGPRLSLFERHGGLLRATQLGRGLQGTAVHFPKLFREPHPTNVVVMRLAADHGSIVTARLLGSIGHENANGIHAPLERRASHMPDRRPYKHISPVEEGLVERAKCLREQASTLQPGPERDRLLRQASRDETASRINDWLTSPGLRRPT